MTNTDTCPQCGSTLTDPESKLCPGCLLISATAEPTADSAVDPTFITPVANSFEPPESAELDKLFPNLDVLELIGRGGMGAVYKARQQDLDRLVAVKILPREIQGDPTFGERFLREAQTLAKLNHPNIVAVYDFGQVEDLFYFVMEFVDGVTLRDTIAAGAVAPEEALRIVPELCDALQFAHEEGVVHRDIKPENILLDRKGRIKIADFGLAKLMKGDQTGQHNLTQTHQVMGTVKYMAPEQMTTTKDVDHRADIYSLGVVFYELLTGDLPMGWFAPPSKKVAVDVRMDEVVLRALEAEPSRRFQHASEVKTAVEALSSAAAAVEKMVGTDGVVKSGTGEVRLHKLVDETITGKRGLQQCLQGIGVALVPFAIAILFVGRLPWYISVLMLVSAVVLTFVSSAMKQNQVWKATYKGHTIRMDNTSLRAERLYLDDGLVKTGGFGAKMEFRFPIKAGNGLGDEIIVWMDVTVSSARCRIEVEEKL